MSLTSYRAAPPRGILCLIGELVSFREILFLSRFGGDLLSHVLRRSTIGATALNGRVRDGTGCFARAMTTKPRKKRGLEGQFSCRSNPFFHQMYCSKSVLLLTVQARLIALLFLDQIKPIGQLVPVS